MLVRQIQDRDVMTIYC